MIMSSVKLHDSFLGHLGPLANRVLVIPSHSPETAGSVWRSSGGTWINLEKHSSSKINDYLDLLDYWTFVWFAFAILYRVLAGPCLLPGPARLTCLPAAPHRVLLSATAAPAVVCSVVTGGFMKDDFKWCKYLQNAIANWQYWKLQDVKSKVKYTFQRIVMFCTHKYHIYVASFPWIPLG